MFKSLRGFGPRSAALALLLACHTALAAPPAAAAPATSKPALAESLSGAAKSDYDAAKILYDDGDFKGALLKLKSAYDASKDPRLLWNMAACEKNLRHYANVAALLDRYLADGSGLVTDAERTEASELLTTVKAFVAPLSVEVNEPDASIFLDGQAVGKSPLPSPLQVDMGAHALRVTKPGFLELTSNVQVEGGQASRVNVVLLVEKHEGRLRIIADPSDVIQVDHKLTKVGLWEGVLPSGAHSVYVSAKGKRAYKTDVVVQDNDLTNLHVALETDSKPVLDKGGVPTWLWVAGGAALVGGGIGAYLLLKPEATTTYQRATPGTWGTIDI
jgi:hypothetical protein